MKIVNNSLTKEYTKFGYSILCKIAGGREIKNKEGQNEFKISVE